MMPPSTSSARIRPTSTYHGWSPASPVLTKVTSSSVGASLSPDSASSAPRTEAFSGTRRSTENTAAESVGEVTAPSSTASSQSRSST